MNTRRRVLIGSVIPGWLLLLRQGFMSFVDSAYGQNAYHSPTALTDIEYGTLPEQRLDLWLPTALTGPYPVCVYFHGGGFGKGNKEQMSSSLRAEILKRGIAVASVSYRLGKNALFPNPMMDGARAIQFLRLQAGAIQIDPTRIAVSGRSAGGALALWLAFHDDLAIVGAHDPVQRQSTRVKAVAVLNAQTTFRSEDIKRLFGKRIPPPFFKTLLGSHPSPEMQEAASPLYHYSAGDPPTLLVYLQKDTEEQKNTSTTSIVHDHRFGDPLIADSKLMRTQIEKLNVQSGEVGYAFAKMAEFLRSVLV